MNAEFKYAQLATGCPQVWVTCNEKRQVFASLNDGFPLPEKDHREKRAMITDKLDRKAWFVRLKGRLQPGDWLTLEIWSPTLNLKLPKYCEELEFVAAIAQHETIAYARTFDSMRRDTPLPHVELAVARLGVPLLPFFSAPRFDVVNGKPLRLRHAGHGGVKPDWLEQTRAGWWLCDGNNLNRRLWRPPTLEENAGAV